jgi:MFS family permease
VSEKEKRNVYRGLFLVNFLVCLGFGIADPFFPVFATANGATGFHLAIIFSGYAVAKTLVSPLTGWWSDRKGRRSLLIGGLCIYSAISLCYLFLPGPLSLIFLRFIQGIAAALVRPVSLAFIGDIAPARREGTVMGTFDISFYGALAIGPVMGGIIKDVAGFPGVFLCLFFLCLLSLATALLFVKSAGKAEKSSAATTLDLSLLRESRILVALCGFIFTRSFGIVLFAIFLPIFMHGSLKLKGVEIGIIMGAATIVTAVLLRPMGYLSDRMKREQLIIVGGSIAALFTCCLPLARTFPHLLILSIGIGISSVISLPASSALLVEEGNRRGMGLTMGIFNGSMNLGTVLAPLAGGIAFGLFGMNALFYGAGLLGLAGTFFFFLYATRLAPSPEKKPFGLGSVQLVDVAPLAAGRRLYPDRMRLGTGS